MVSTGIGDIFQFDFITFCHKSLGEACGKVLKFYMKVGGMQNIISDTVKSDFIDLKKFSYWICYSNQPLKIVIIQTLIFTMTNIVCYTDKISDECNCEILMNLLCHKFGWLM